MGWIVLATVGVASAALLWRLGVARGLWAFVGSALMLGAAGYALQGRPMLPGKPVEANARPIEVDEGVIQLREAMVGRMRADTAYLTAADGLTRAGESGRAVQVILSGIQRYPDSMALWTGLGTALATHDGEQMSPAALFAFSRAAKLAPLNPAPHFFAGLAYIRAGDFPRARPFWAQALRLTPPGLSYREELAFRLALLDQLAAETEQMPTR